MSENENEIDALLLKIKFILLQILKLINFKTISQEDQTYDLSNLDAIKI